MAVFGRSDLTHTQTLQLLRQGASKALYGWETDLEVDELTNELWIWYNGSPAIQAKLASLRRGEAVRYVKHQAVNILSGYAKKTDVFQDRILYPTGTVKDALLGKSNNKYLLKILPDALKALQQQNIGYAAALRSRYEDGVVPPQGAELVRLTRATKALTEHVNVLAIMAGLDTKGNLHDGPGSKALMQKRRPVYKHEESPEIRRVKGEHSDPTANIAIMLIEHPELRDEYLHEDPITDYTGAGRC